MRLSKLLASSLFPVGDLKLVGTKEKSVKGGRGLFPLVKTAFEKASISQIAIIGWGSQGPSHAQNLRDTLKSEKSDINVVVGLRENSSSFQNARNAGFNEEDGTLMEMFTAIQESDMVIVLISDAAQSDLMPDIMANMKSGATLGLAHGFIYGHMKSIGDTWRNDINVIMVAPKGMGPSVRALYVQGKETEGAGINSSIAIEQDYNGDAMDIAIAWGIGIGSPYIFQTTLESEYKSDIFGERGDLLGGVWALVEILYRKYLKDGMSEEDAFKNSAESLTGPISRMISDNKIQGLYESFNHDEQVIFNKAYSDFYNHSFAILSKIYDEVSSGREIQEVIQKGKDLEKNPMKPVGGTKMWKVGKLVRNSRVENEISINPYTAGAYCAMIIAQVNLLVEKGHPWSEIANESVIEATDSLNPYMHKNGVGFMVDGCSVTARLGARKWGPEFEKVFDLIKETDEVNSELTLSFLQNPIHEVLKIVGEMRPLVKISL